MNPELAGLIRHALTMLGGILVTKGYSDSTVMESIVGGFVATIGVLWSLYAKRGTSGEAAKVADKVAADVPKI